MIGLSLARALGRRGRQATLLEAESELGQHTSSRNSEVIHGGLYYPPGSLKARLCVAGKQQLYAYAAEAGVDHARVGKLVVATDDAELQELEKLAQNAAHSGVDDLQWLGAADVTALEPAVKSAGGLFSPSTGIIDSHGLMSALRRDALRDGAEIVTRSPVLGGAVTTDGFELRIGGAAPSVVTCRQVINAAGLWAQEVARSIEGVPEASIPGQFFAKGQYYVLRGRSPFTHLVYPVPVPGGLGVHVTLDLSGAARFGPDVEWSAGIDYSFDPGREPQFSAAIRRYFPALPADALLPGHVGIRPKLAPRGAVAQDFLVQGPSAHSVPGLLNLYGIESPGLTAALAIAELAQEAMGSKRAPD